MPADVGFDTHSDGDVLSHAVIDALAGAIADGDLGPTTPRMTRAPRMPAASTSSSSSRRPCAGRAIAVANLDTFVVLGTVRLRPHMDGMRANLAEALQLPPARVSVKARSNDGLGLEGTGQAVSATAVVLIIAPRGEAHARALHDRLAVDRPQTAPTDRTSTP